MKHEIVYNILVQKAFEIQFSKKNLPHIIRKHDIFHYLSKTVCYKCEYIDN